MLSNKNNSTILESILVATIALAALVIAVVLARMTDGIVMIASVILIAIAAMAAIIAIMNRKVHHQDIAEGVSEFLKDRSFRFETKDDGCDAVNHLFDQICYNDEQNRLLIRNISHEVKTPLTGLKVMAEGISDGVFEANWDNMKVILDDVNRIDETLTVMKQYSNIMDDNQLLGEGGDAATSLFAAYERAKRVAPEGVEVVSKSDPGNGFKTIVRVDSSSLATLFDIVIGNSFEHAEGMTKLELSIKNAVEPTTKKEMLKVSIADNGCGMDMDLDQARKAFTKANDARTISDRSKTSLGLGLSIADKIMANAGGKMVITSKPGVGTCTTMWFPPLDEC